MLRNGFVKIYRSILDWEWYDDINTTRLFLHLLLTVSIEKSQWHGVDIERGSRVSSYAILARETKLSVKQIRAALSHLETTGEVARTKYPKFTVFTVVNFDTYQEKGQGKRQGKGSQAGSEGAGKGQQYKKIKEDIRNKEDARARDIPSSKEWTEEERKRLAAKARE